MASRSTGKTTCITCEDFVTLHRPQFLSIGLPEHLWGRLYKKLTPTASWDTAEVFEVREGGQFGSAGRWSLHAKRALQKFSDVFLIEHAWSSDGGPTAKKNLEKSPELLARMEEIMQRPENSASETASSDEAALDSSLVLSQLTGIDRKKAEEALQATDSDLIEALCQITDDSYESKKPSKSDRSKIMTLEEFKTGFLHSVGMEKAKLLSQEYVEKMYLRYKREKEQYPDSLCFGKGTTPQYSWFEEDEGSMAVFVSIPVTTKKRDVVNKLSTKRWTLGLKGCPPVINGEFYGNICPDESFWTFDSPGLLVMTLQKPENEESELWPVLIKGEKHLTEKEISDVARDNGQKADNKMSEVLENMWYYNQTYTAVGPDGNKQKPVWYVMDEFGSAVVHAVQPNVKCSPFAFVATGTFYSLLWPLEDINIGDVCTRNFCQPLSMAQSKLHQEARLFAFGSSLPEVSPSNFVVELAKFPSLPKENSVVVNVRSLSPRAESVKCSLSKGRKLNLKIFLEKNGREKKPILRDLGCTVVESSVEAEALWLEKWNALGQRIQHDARINRLGGEENLLHRHLLSAHVQKTWGNVPWFPVSYDMSVHDLAALCADHYCRGISSYWILRAADPSALNLRPIVTSDLRRVLRCTEMGHLVASYYCARTAWCRKRRFCLQYAVTVKSLEPLEILVHNTPHVNLAESEIDQNRFLDEYDLSALLSSRSDVKQNGVVNHKLTHEEFLVDFNANYLVKGELSWDDVQGKIHESIGKLFYAVAPRLCSLQDGSSMSRDLCAVYGVDVLIKDNLEPLIIGVDPTPTFDSQKCFSDVLVTAFGQNGECLDCVNITQVSVR